jgi:hypothetical protein
MFVLTWGRGTDVEKSQPGLLASLQSLSKDDLVATMLAHPNAVAVQEEVCNLFGPRYCGSSQEAAGAVGAVEAITAAVSNHLNSQPVLDRAVSALYNLTMLYGSGENKDNLVRLHKCGGRAALTAVLQECPNGSYQIKEFTPLLVNRLASLA